VQRINNSDKMKKRQSFAKPKVPFFANAPIRMITLNTNFS
jgi:hypothetical protein